MVSSQFPKSPPGRIHRREMKPNAGRREWGGTGSAPTVTPGAIASQDPSNCVEEISDDYIVRLAPSKAFARGILFNFPLLARAGHAYSCGQLRTVLIRVLIKEPASRSRWSPWRSLRSKILLPPPRC